MIIKRKNSIFLFFFSILLLVITADLFPGEQVAKQQLGKKELAKAKHRKDINVLLGLEDKTPNTIEDSKANPNSHLYKTSLSLYKQALLAFYLENYSEAQELFKKIISLNPLQREIYGYLGKINDLSGKGDLNKSFSQPDELEQVLSQRNEIMFNNGLKKFLKGEYLEARKIWENLQKSAPDYNATYTYLAKCDKKLEASAENFLQSGIDAYENGDIKKAEKIWTKGLSFLPNHSGLQAHINMAKDRKKREVAIAILETKKLYKNGNTKGAIEVLRNTQIKYPSNKDIKKELDTFVKSIETETKKTFSLVSELMSKGLYIKAQEKLKLLNLIDPGNSIINRYIKECQKGVELEKNRALLLNDYKYAIGLLNKGKCRAALDLFRQIKDQDSLFNGIKKSIQKARDCSAYNTKRTRSTSLMKKANKSFKNKDYRTAIKYWNKILKINPSNEMVKQYLTIANKKLRVLKKETSLEKIALKKSKQIYTKSIRFYKQNKLKDSYKLLKQANKLNPKDKKISLAIIKVREAIIKKEETLTPKKEKEASVWFFKGVGLYRKGKYYKALKCWKTTVKYNPSHPRAIKYIQKVENKIRKIEKI